MLSAVLLSSPFSFSTRAQSPSPEGEAEASARAKDAFNRGNAFFEKKNYDEASVAFREAQQIMPSWKLYYNIAQAEAAARHYDLALEDFEKYVAEGGDDVPEARLEEVLKEMLRLRMMVGNVKILGGPDGAEVRVGGRPRAVLPLVVELRVTAGVAQRIEIVLDDQHIHSQNITVGSGSTAEIRLSDKSDGPVIDEERSDTQSVVAENAPMNDSPVAPLATPEPKPTKKPLLWTGISAGAVGIAAGGVALGFFLASNHKYDQFNTMNDEIRTGERSPDDKNVKDLKSEIQTFDNVAIAMVITSGVLLVTSTVLISLHVARNNKSERAEAGVGTLIVRF